ncbi:signal peptidase I [Pontibacter chitinilyticus]|uniref:signal peptidase I n=1 Tax=Pontibacter chitinilyticus TaxID=2674989 RepID=UPI00321A445F
MAFKFWNSESSKTKPQKSVLRQWSDAVMFAVVFATLIRWSTFEAFAIPSSSMEKTLLTGDYLFVSKLHYGTRIPLTPVQVPLTHQTIWGTNIPSYSDVIQLPYYRLPGFSEVRRNDLVVFNHPNEAARPVDLKTDLIKRCVGVAGDTITIRHKQVYLNGKAVENPGDLQFSYFIKTDKVLSQTFFHKQDITDVYLAQGGYIVYTLPEKAAFIRSLDFVQGVTLLEAKHGEAEPGIFPGRPGTFSWNKDNFGPLYIPKAGATVAITPQILPLYEKVILTYEHNQNAEIREGKLFINGKEVNQYTFKQNYYFMMGDNRHNSNDSRYWGFVPEEYLIGKAVFVWMSVDSSATFPNKIRWNRLLHTID